MRKFWQTEWFGIKFNTFTNLTPNKQADEIFYSKFYNEFFKKFNSYAELPKDWKKDKELLANFISIQIQDKANVLSIGCGSGFIENELSKINGEEGLVAIEPSIKASSWIEGNPKVHLINGYFPTALSQEYKFDFAYMSYIDYIFNDNLYLKILEDIKSYPINKFLLIGASIHTKDFKSTIKYYIKNILLKTGLLQQQLWGYQRTIEEHLEIFRKAKFKNIDYGQLDNGVYWIKGTNA